MLNPKIWKNYFDVVILPSKEVSDYAIKLSRQLHKHGTPWALGKENFIPHISLYHIPVKPKDFNDFVSELEMIVRGFKIKKLKIKEVRLWKNFAVCAYTDKPEWLRKLYLTVIKRTLKYFDWDYGAEKTWGGAKKSRKQSRLVIKNLKEYGTPMFGRYFMPHITLSIFKNNKNVIEAFSKLQTKRLSFGVKSIFVCELGETHSCQRIVKKIDFSIDPEGESDEGKNLSNREMRKITLLYEKSFNIPSKKPSKQILLCPIGIVGSGKTTVLRPLSKKLSLLRISSDVVRRLLKERGYNYIRAREIAFNLIEKYAQRGYSIVIDADCIDPRKRKRIEKLAKETRAKIIWIHINPPEKYIINKLRRFKHTWLFRDGNDAIHCYFSRKLLHRKLKFPFIYTFDTSRSNLKKQIDSAAALIKEKLY